MSRLQPVNRLRDLVDRIKGRGWYAPRGTYDGVEGGRPFRHLRCHVCGGAHYAGNPPHRLSEEAT